MANWKKSSIAAGILVLVAVAVGLGTALYLRPKAQPPVPPPAAQTAADKDLVLQGRAYCSLTAPIDCPMLAKVAEVLVTVGQAVKKNQPLLRLDLLPADAASMAQRANKGTSIHSQELNIQQIELKLAQLERNIAEMRKLEAVDLAPRNALPELLEQQSYGRRQLENARQTLADARRAAAEDLTVLSDLLGYTVTSGSLPRTLVVRAPQDGHIISVEPSVTPGASVSGKVMTLGVMDPMIIRGQVHESEIGRMKAGEKASITLDSGKDEPPMQATLTSVSWAAQDSSLAAPSYYLFELTVPNPDLVIRDGNKVRVTFKAKPAASAAQNATAPSQETQASTAPVPARAEQPIQNVSQGKSAEPAQPAAQAKAAKTAAKQHAPKQSLQDAGSQVKQPLSPAPRQ